MAKLRDEGCCWSWPVLQDQWIGDAENSKGPGNFGIWRWCVDRWSVALNCAHFMQILRNADTRHLHADLEQSAGFCGNEFCMSNEIIPTLFCLVEVSLLPVIVVQDKIIIQNSCYFIFCRNSLLMSVTYILQTSGQYCKSKASHASTLSDFLQLYR